MHHLLALRLQGKVVQPSGVSPHGPTSPTRFHPPSRGIRGYSAKCTLPTVQLCVFLFADTTANDSMMRGSEELNIGFICLPSPKIHIVQPMCQTLKKLNDRIRKIRNSSPQNRRLHVSWVSWARILDCNSFCRDVAIVCGCFEQFWAYVAIRKITWGQ
jgi:hypothetical protein